MFLSGVSPSGAHPGVLSLDGHEVAEQGAHRRRELGLVEEVASLSDRLRSRRVGVDHARQAPQPDLVLHRDRHLAAKQNNHEKRDEGTCLITSYSLQDVAQPSNHADMG